MILTEVNEAQSLSMKDLYSMLWSTLHCCDTRESAWHRDTTGITHYTAVCTGTKQNSLIRLITWFNFLLLLKCVVFVTMKRRRPLSLRSDWTIALGSVYLSSQEGKKCNYTHLASFCVKWTSHNSYIPTVWLCLTSSHCQVIWSANRFPTVAWLWGGVPPDFRLLTRNKIKEMLIYIVCIYKYIHTHIFGGRPHHFQMRPSKNKMLRSSLVHSKRCDLV